MLTLRLFFSIIACPTGPRLTFNLEIATDERLAHVNGLDVNFHVVFLTVRLLCATEFAASAKHRGGVCLNQLVVRLVSLAFIPTSCFNDTHSVAFYT